MRRKLRFRGPDFFVVFNPFPKPFRRSWVVENENGKYPDVIVEVLSKSTESKDRGEKKAIYQNIFRTPEYFLVDPEKGTLEGYLLVNGRYQPMTPNERGHLWSERLGMAIGQVYDPELGLTFARFFTAEGEMFPDAPEAAQQAMAEADAEKARAEKEKARAENAEARAEHEKARAEQEKARAEQAEQDKARLLAKLREFGIDPGCIGQESRPRYLI